MTFEHRDRQGGGSVNVTTDREGIPECALAGVMREVIQRVLGLRAKFGDRARFLIKKINVKNAFRQVPVDPDGAAAFGYALVGTSLSTYACSSSGGVVRGGGVWYRR